jgi:hypothetical protein
MLMLLLSKTIGERIEESNEDLSHKLNAIQDISKKSG